MLSDNLLTNMSYTNKSFQDVYEEMLDLAEKISYRWNPKESNESDPGVVLLKLCAILADKLNYNIDKNVLECFPVSVTQESNARELFAQLGYFMPWYRGASGEIQISWKGEDTGYIYSLPRFSMVSNDDNSIVYTLISDVALSSDGSIANCDAIQGVIQDFMVNGDTIITTQNLDSKNRLYFGNYNIAENGIFISNSLFGYDDWRRVDNLNIESYGSPVFKFGVSSENGVCYLEFPEDAYNIFGDGITIKYISTDGQDGNVSSKIITKFFNDPSVYYTDDNNDEQSLLLTTADVYVTNNNSIRNGSNPEKIEEAYKNYQKTIGTFNTLITLRDYNNAVRSAKINDINIVSNGFVTDRTNDIQCSYKIVTDVQDIRKTVYAVEEQDDSPHIDAFDLKMYLLENIQTSGDIIQSSNKISNSANTYNTTFNMVDNTELAESYKVDLLKESLAETKCVQHDFQPLLSDKLCMLKNKYPVECKIIPQYKLTSVQANSVKANIIKELYNSFNSRKISFGDSISYDELYKVILNSDERIKSVMLGDITYTTYAVYYDSSENEYKEIEINSLDNFIAGYLNPTNNKFYYDYNKNTQEYLNEITIVDNILYKDCVSTESDQNKVVYITATEENSIKDGSGIKVGTKLMVRFRYDAMPDNSTETNLYLSIINSQSNTSVCPLYQIKESVNGSFQDLSSEKSLCWDSGSTRLFTFNGTYWVIDFEDNYSSKDSMYTFVDMPTGICYKYTDGKPSDYIKSDIQTDIYAKSVLGGVTQLLEPDDIFEYRMNQKFVDYIEDISNVSTNSNIHLESPSGEAEKTLRDNEYIRFYSPNLEDDTTYSSYVKFQYAISQDVDTDSDYMLQGDETITFYWKESDDENASYKYYKYGAGTIIHPNFSLRSPSSYMTLDENNSRFGVSYTHPEDDIPYIGLKYSLGSGTCNYSDSSRLASVYDSDYILSSTKSIVIRKKIEATIKYPMYAYWILNEKKTTQGGKYVYQLFSETSLQQGESEIRQEYILQPGEYFIYTNASKSSIEILSAGTKLTRTSTLKKVEPMICDAADTDDVIDTGVSSIDDVLKQINFNDTITATEMQIKTVPANATLYLSALTWEADSVAAQTPSELTGTRIYGEGTSPQSENLKATQGRTAYNEEYSSSWQWHEDEDGEGNPVYSSSGLQYGANVDLSSISNSDVTGKTPLMLGIQPNESYVLISSLSAPEFYDGDFYQLVNGNYVKLTTEPANWQTNYMNYYWKKPNHAYNPRYSTALVWEDDENLQFSDRAPYISIWNEDESYLALGYKVDQENLFPDLIKLDHRPTDYDECGHVEKESPYDFEDWWNLNGKSERYIQSVLVGFSSKKYFKAGNDYYQNMRYQGDMENSLPKTTYHAYNPKFQSNGYVWDTSGAPENDNLEDYIKITGEGCSPQSCIIVPQKGLIVYDYVPSADFFMAWESISNGHTWQLLEDAPSDSYYTNTYEAYSIDGDTGPYDYRDMYEQYTYLKLILQDNSVMWYQNIIVSENIWQNVTNSYTPQQLLNDRNAVEITFGAGEVIDLTGSLVTIIPKQGLKAVNIPSDLFSVEIYNTTYFEVIEDYIEKSWTQTIVFDPSVEELSGNSYITPVTEGIQPVLDTHICHQFDSYAWLEDYSYAFEDNIVAGTSNVIGNSRSVSGVGVSPISEGIAATQDGKAYNPAYSYNYMWQEDSQYISWDSPIAILTGQANPTDSNISVFALEQHVINPNYVSGYRWVRLNSTPRKYANNNQLVNEDTLNGKLAMFTNSDSGKEPPFEANYYENAKYAYNNGVSPFVWFQKSPVYGKSWTSVRIPVGKSWTSHPVTVSDSWTAVNEYSGKSWYSSKDNIPMLWRSVPTAVNVTFKKDGAEILAPAGYTLNDFVIKSKLEDSSEIEEWPKVIVDDGWEAYSSLDLKVSKNTPFELYEDQELEWFTKDYHSSNDNSKTHGTISGRYIFTEYDNIDNLDDIMYKANISNVTSANQNLVYCRLIPGNNLHLYCRETKQSWLAVYTYRFYNDANGASYDDNILVDEVWTTGYKIGDEWIPLDRAGVHCYIVSNGNTYYYTSYQSESQVWQEQPQEYYSEYGIRVHSVVFSSESAIACDVYPQKQVALMSSSKNYVSTYIPINILSDFGYDIDGGNMIDVSRLNLEGNLLYMNIYSYELIEYSDEDISVDGNFLKINVAYSEYERIDTLSTAWESGLYYSRSGSGTKSDPYFYVPVNSAPSASEWEGGTYYRKTHKLSDNYSIQKNINFNFNTGKYLLKFMNSSPDIRSLTIDVLPIRNGNVLSGAVRLHEFGDETFTDFYKSRKYYIDLNTEYLKSAFSTFANCDEMQLVINIEFNTPELSYYETKGYLSFDLAYKYDKPESMSQDLFNIIVNKIELLDKDRLYDFSYVVDKDILIENPLDSESFMNTNHIYNKFTICQMDTQNSDVYITNSTK